MLMLPMETVMDFRNLERVPISCVTRFCGR